MNALDEIQERAEEELSNVWAELARDNYVDFYEFMNREDGYECSPHQLLIADMLMAAERREIMRGMISMPPGHCKSTHCSHHFPAWYFGRNKKARFLQAGHSQDFVENEMGQKVRSIIDSDDYRLVFPDIRIRSDMRAKAYWGLTNRKGLYVGKGVGQGIAGFRGHFGAVDDMYKSRKDAESPTVRDATFKWYSDDFATRLLPGSPLFIVMTRWHSDDVCGRITDRERKEQEEIEEKIREGLLKSIEEAGPLNNRYKFQVINLPAIAEDNDVLGRAPGEALWPELYDLEQLAVLRADMTAASWNSLYQGTPIDIMGGAVQSDWFKRYEVLPAKATEGQPTQRKRVTVSVDAANTEKERSDWTVITVWIEDFNKNHYLADVVRKQIEFVELSQEIEKACKRWDADALLVEAKGNGLAYIQLKKNGGAPAPLIPIEVGTASKEFRFDKVTPMFEAGQVHLPTRAVWLADYEKEILAFPSGKHDDQVDSTSQYLDWTRKKGRRGTKKVSGSGYGR